MRAEQRGQEVISGRNPWGLRRENPNMRRRRETFWTVPKLTTRWCVQHKRLHFFGASAAYFICRTFVKWVELVAPRTGPHIPLTTVQTQRWTPATGGPDLVARCFHLHLLGTVKSHWMEYLDKSHLLFMSPVFMQSVFLCPSAIAGRRWRVVLPGADQQVTRSKTWFHFVHQNSCDNCPSIAGRSTGPTATCWFSPSPTTTATGPSSRCTSTSGAFTRLETSRWSWSVRQLTSVILP